MTSAFPNGPNTSGRIGATVAGDSESAGMRPRMSAQPPAYSTVTATTNC